MRSAVLVRVLRCTLVWPLRAFVVTVGVLLCACGIVAPPTPRPVPNPVEVGPTPSPSPTPTPTESPSGLRYRIEALAGTLDMSSHQLGAGEGGPAQGAPLANIYALAVSPAGDVYVAESLLGARPGDVQTLVRRIDQRGVIRTVGGPSQLGYVGALGFMPDGDPLIGGQYASAAIFRLHAGTLQPFAGTSHTGERADGGPALAASIFGPAGLGYDAGGTLYIGDWADGRVRRIRPDGVIESSGTAPQRPFGFAVDAAGNVYVASDLPGATLLYRIAPDGTGSVIAGVGTGFGGDGGPATRAQFKEITAVALGRAGEIFVLDSGNRRVRRIDAHGIVTTVAGTGQAGYTGDGGPALSANLAEARWLAVGPEDSLYIATNDPSTVRRLVLAP